jgi:hypothetical protein
MMSKVAPFGERRAVCLAGEEPRSLSKELGISEAHGRVKRLPTWEPRRHQELRGHMRQTTLIQSESEQVGFAGFS